MQMSSCMTTRRKRSDSLDGLSSKHIISSGDGLLWHVFRSMQHKAVHGYSILRHRGPVPQLGHHQQVALATGPAHYTPQLYCLLYMLHHMQLLSCHTCREEQCQQPGTHTSSQGGGRGGGGRELGQTGAGGGGGAAHARSGQSKARGGPCLLTALSWCCLWGIVLQRLIEDERRLVPNGIQGERLVDASRRPGET